MLTIPSDRPLDTLLLALLGRMDVAARETGIEYFVSGALARDLVLLHVFGKESNEPGSNKTRLRQDGATPPVTSPCPSTP